MVFEMSFRARIEEELIEAKSFYDNFTQDVEKVLEHLSQNVTLDHQNDRTRSQVTRFLIDALSAANMRSFEDVNKHLNGALQKLHSQEGIDLKDDLPRIEAMMKLSRMMERAIGHSQRLRGLIKENAELKEVGQ